MLSVDVVCGPPAQRKPGTDNYSFHHGSWIYIGKIRTQGTVRQNIDGKYSEIIFPLQSDRSERKGREPDCLIRLYASLQFALDTEEFKKFVEVTEKRMMEKEDTETEEDADDAE